jgi:kumamolisin
MATLTVRVRSAKEDLEELEQHVYEQSAKPLKDRTYLSPGEYKELRGANPADLDRVEQFAQIHNLTIVHRDDAARTVVLNGALGSLLNAFPAQVAMYHHANGTYRGRTGDIQIPAELADVVTTVLGYDNRPKHRVPRFVRFGAANGPGGENGVAATVFA